MKKVIFTLATLVVSSTAFAQAYVGIAGGASKQNIDCSGLSSCDTSATGFKVYTGVKFTPMFAGELSYTDFGKVKATYFTVSAGYQTTAVSIGGAFFAPLAPDLNAVFRLGVSSNKAKLTASVSGFSTSDSETHTAPYLGLGLGYEVTRGLSINGAIDATKTRYGDEKSNATLLSVGLSYTF